MARNHFRIASEVTVTALLWWPFLSPAFALQRNRNSGQCWITLPQTIISEHNNEIRRDISMEFL